MSNRAPTSTPRAADAAAIAEAVTALAAGELVVFPTETVYGLGADATNSAAVAAIFAAKGRPSFNPLIIHVADLAEADRHAVLAGPARRLAAAFWPGPFTLVLPLRPESPLSPLVSAGLPSVAVRMPAHATARALLKEFGKPVAAPSANRSGRVSPTQAADAAAELGGQVALILDGGPAREGLESTIVQVLDGAVELLRPGSVTPEEIAEVSGLPVHGSGPNPAKIVSPGQLLSHYAPNAQVRPNATAVAPGEALLAFGPKVPAGAFQTLNLSPTGNLREAAANLFTMLRRLDAGGASTIAVMPIPETGVGLAINDRLRRAAAPRPKKEAS